MKHKLEELFTLRREVLSDGLFLIVNGDDFISNSPYKLTNYNYAEFPNKKLQKAGYNQYFQKGDILFLTIGAKKKIWLADMEGICASGNNKIKIIVSQKKICIPEYLALIITSRKVTNWAFDCLTGTTVPQINWKIFTDKISVNVPSLIEQQKKTNVFSQIESWKLKTKNLIEKVNLIITMNFAEKTYNFSNTRQKIKDVCFIDPSKTRIFNKEHLFSFLPLEDLENDSIYVYPKKQKLISGAKGYKFFQENDLLLAKISPSFENGKMSIGKSLLNGGCFGSTELCIIKAKENTLIEWVYYCLKNPIFLQKGKQAMRGTAGQQRIKIDFVSNYLIPFPSLDKQTIILSVLQKLENFSVKVRSLSKLIDLFLEYLKIKEEEDADIKVTS